jgi:hypothetical protein
MYLYRKKIVIFQVSIFGTHREAPSPKNELLPTATAAVEAAAVEAAAAAGGE